MGRWRALAAKSQADASGDQPETEGSPTAGANGPPSLEQFLDANHRLFTLIGVFGALSVYLMKFRTTISADGGTGISTGPVGAVLLLFLLTSALAVRNSYRCTQRAREHGAYLLVFGYAVFMYSFVTLVVSVVFVIWTRYAQGAENVLGSSFVYALVFLYVPFAFRTEVLREFEGATPLAAGVRFAPYLAAGLLAVWYAMRWDLTALPAVPLDSAATAIGTVLGVLGNHFVITVAVVGAFWTLDRATVHLWKGVVRGPQDR